MVSPWRIRTFEKRPSPAPGIVDGLTSKSSSVQTTGLRAFSVPLMPEQHRTSCLRRNDALVRKGLTQIDPAHHGCQGLFSILVPEKGWVLTFPKLANSGGAKICKMGGRFRREGPNRDGAQMSSDEGKRRGKVLRKWFYENET